MSEIAGQGSYSVKGLREIGVDADLAVWRSNPSKYYSPQYDLKIGYKKCLYPWYFLKMVSFALKSMFKYDCFHLHFAHSLIPKYLDLPILKLLKKKVFFEFHGSDVRNMIKEIPHEYMEPVYPDKKQARRLKKLAKYADGFIIHDEELRPHLPGKDVPVYVVPLRLDIEKFKPKYPDINEKNPLIVHAPSIIPGKGTEFIQEAMAKISMKYRWKLVHGMTQEEAVKIYKEADIVFDQISGCGTYGVFAIEAMALGKPVMCDISEEMKGTFPDNLPIVSVWPYDIKEKLEMLLSDSQLRNRLGKKGRIYAEGYHDYKKNAELLKKIYEGDY